MATLSHHISTETIQVKNIRAAWEAWALKWVVSIKFSRDTLVYLNASDASKVYAVLNHVLTTEEKERYTYDQATG